MSCALCSVSLAALAEQVAMGRTSGVRACPACAERMASVEALLRVAGSFEPMPADPRDRQRRIAQALSVAPRAPVRWPIWITAGVSLAACGALALYLRSKPAPDVAPVLAAGALQHDAEVMGAGARVKEEQSWVVSSGERAEVRLFDGTELRAEPRTQFSIAERSSQVKLRKGRMAFAVKPRPKTPFVVHTEDARVQVIGTRFVVDKALSATHVEVEEGTVVVQSAAGETRRLIAGETWDVGAPIREPEPTPLPSVAPSEPAPPPSAAPSASSEPKDPKLASHAPNAADIRARLAAGDVAKARQLMAEARARAAKIPPAEFAILDAEALRAERRYGEAIDAYLGVTKRFGGSPQAEEALFAAAQLSIRNKGNQRHGAADLLHQYQQRYPQGRFRDQVDRYLRALEPNP